MRLGLSKTTGHQMSCSESICHWIAPETRGEEFRIGAESSPDLAAMETGLAQSERATCDARFDRITNFEGNMMDPDPASPRSRSEDEWSVLDSPTAERTTVASPQGMSLLIYLSCV